MKKNISLITMINLSCFHGVPSECVLNFKEIISILNPKMLPFFLTRYLNYGQLMEREGESIYKWRELRKV